MIIKVFHFESILKNSSDLWALRVSDGPYGFWLPLEVVQKAAKQYGLKQLSALNKKLEDRLVVVTYDGASVVHDLVLKADYRGPKIPDHGIERRLDIGDSFNDRRRAAAGKDTPKGKGLPSVSGLVELLRSNDEW